MMSCQICQKNKGKLFVIHPCGVCNYCHMKRMTNCVCHSLQCADQNKCKNYDKNTENTWHTMVWIMVYFCQHMN